jgi:hypothetical protein
MHVDFKPLLGDGVEFKLGMSIWLPVKGSAFEIHTSEETHVILGPTLPEQAGYFAIAAKDSKQAYVDLLLFFSSRESALNSALNNLNLTLQEMDARLAEMKKYRDRFKEERDYFIAAMPPLKV